MFIKNKYVILYKSKNSDVWHCHSSTAVRKKLSNISVCSTLRCILAPSLRWQITRVGLICSQLMKLENLRMSILVENGPAFFSVIKYLLRVCRFLKSSWVFYKFSKVMSSNLTKHLQVCIKNKLKTLVVE